MGRLRLGLFGSFVLVLIVLSVAEVSAITRYVRVPGRSPYYETIQAAVNDAIAGDTIVVGAGIYYEQIVIAKDNLTIRPQTGSVVIVPPELTPAGIHITGNGNTFRGFTVVDATTSGHSHAHRLIFVQGDNNRVVENILVGRGEAGYADWGIVVRGGGIGDGVAQGNAIRANEVRNVLGANGGGIVSVSVSSNNGASETQIVGNYVHDCTQGIYVDRSPNCVVRGNIVENNLELGIAVRSRTQSQGLSSAGTVVRGNTVVNNPVGILLLSCANVSVGSSTNPNYITDNEIGVLVDYEIHNGVTNTGVPTVRYNNIEGNEVAGLMNNMSERVDARNNWWGDPGGPGADADGDGVQGDFVVGNVRYSPWSTTPLP